MPWAGHCDAVQEDDDVCRSDDAHDDFEQHAPTASRTWAGTVNEMQEDDDDSASDNEYQDAVNAQLEQEASESDIEDTDPTHAHEPTTTSEKRRAQDEIFKTYANRKTEQITENEVQEAIHEKDDEKLSIRDILAKQETSAQITNPRDYQTELFQRAKEDNIIAVLDTGSGKTHIATLLLRHILDEELQRREDRKPPRTAFFLVIAPFHILIGFLTGR
jgi:endoribonuclease Dicer